MHPYIEVLRLVAAVLDDAAAAEEGRVHVVGEAEGRAEAAQVRPRAGGGLCLARMVEDEEEKKGSGGEVDQGIEGA